MHIQTNERMNNTNGWLINGLMDEETTEIMISEYMNE